MKIIKKSLSMFLALAVLSSPFSLVFADLGSPKNYEIIQSSVVSENWDGASGVTTANVSVYNSGGIITLVDSDIDADFTPKYLEPKDKAVKITNGTFNNPKIYRTNNEDDYTKVQGTEFSFCLPAVYTGAAEMMSVLNENNGFIREVVKLNYDATLQKGYISSNGAKYYYQPDTWYTIRVAFDPANIAYRTWAGKYGDKLSALNTIPSPLTYGAANGSTVKTIQLAYAGTDSSIYFDDFKTFLYDELEADWEINSTSKKIFNMETSVVAKTTISGYTNTVTFPLAADEGLIPKYEGDKVVKAPRSPDGWTLSRVTAQLAESYRTGNIGIEFSFYASNSDNAEIAGIYGTDINDARYAVELKNGYVQIGNQNVIPYAPGKWYDVKIIVDTDKKQYRGFVGEKGGSLTASGAFTKTYLTSATIFWLLNDDGSNSNSELIMYYDDVMLYQYSKSLKIASSGFTDGNNNALDVLENGMINFEAILTHNKSNHTVDAQPIMALYNKDGNLVKISAGAPVTDIAGETPADLTVSMTTTDEVADGCKARVFVWKNLENIEPFEMISYIGEFVCFK